MTNTTDGTTYRVGGDSPRIFSKAIRADFCVSQDFAGQLIQPALAADISATS